MPELYAQHLRGGAQTSMEAGGENHRRQAA